MLISQASITPQQANVDKMRTYSRKRPEYKEIEDVHNLCRLCLGNANGAIPIFKNNESGDVCAAVALRIMICVGLEMTNEDCLPNTICQECHNELERHYAFRKKCETSYQKLKSHVLAVKEKEYNLKMAQQKEQSDMGPLVTLKRLDDSNSIFSNKVAADFLQPSQLLKQSDTKSQPFKQSVKSSQLMKPLLKSNVPDSSKEPVPQFNGIQNNSIANELSPNTTNYLNSDTLNPPSAVLQNKDGNTDVSNNELEEMEFSTFLSSMLVELGILSHQNETVEFVDMDTKMLELETGDGQQLTVELTEEESDKEQREEVVTINGDEGKQSVVIQYITSNYNEKHKNGVPIKGPAWCSTCGKKFVSMSVVARHVRDVHVRERPFACRVCGKTFAQKEVMLRHQHIHEAERPYKCGECSKSYAQRGALLAHAQAHLPTHARAISLHQCPKCPKVFLYSSGLSRHMSTHTGRQYVCGGCRRQFNDKSALKRHMATANHGSNLPPPNLKPAPRSTASDTAG
ncbi:zinc finger protein with KRAB and SCAN domains 7-like isoform X2 [Hyposmocoma kahamanoa]|uniref:zinc finger protein with KRAB and SCAN domains 7-like isoform X2 n=1 Tax=Hyposmocoma kahamanoa TaxID=1477025 RepID=UPI000E6D77AE|nr:zinc finger protein with KRAB and SCAN domains 7-like isoform X2 [Hyposmocoma kahamanoa]